jgi:hypothetical protein
MICTCVRIQNSSLFSHGFKTRPQTPRFNRLGAKIHTQSTDNKTCVGKSSHKGGGELLAKLLGVRMGGKPFELMNLDSENHQLPSSVAEVPLMPEQPQ